MKRILITGISGLLGNNLSYYLKDQYTILGLYNQHTTQIPGIKTAKVDLTKGEELIDIINKFNPEIVIHCAALSDIDYCEENQNLAYQVNVLGTRRLIDAIRSHGSKFIYISTDAVYDNSNGSALNEEDKINPANYYGETKYLGELEALKSKNALILRTNIFGWNIQDKYSIAEWVIHELSNKREIQGFNDVQFSSIYTFELGRILDKAIKKDIQGIYNCSSRTSMTKYEFAVKLANYFKLNTSLINSISVDDFVFKANRRKCLDLDVGKLEKILDFRMPTIEESIDHFYQDYQNALPEEIKSIDEYIPYGRHTVDDDDIQAVLEVLKSKYLTQGPKISEFEGALSKITGALFASAVNSGTSALHISCLAVGIGPGDEVITSPNTFVASANCIVYCGAKPVFVDIDPNTYNISPSQIEKHINERTKAIIPVDFAGQSCDMEEIRRIVSCYEKKYGHKIYIIEDACHALGSWYKGMKVGSCEYSDMTVMSFHPIKHVTTGEGGVVLTNDKNIQRKLKYLRSHGITNTPEEFFYPEHGFESQQDGSTGSVLKPWYYEQNCLGFNYRITDIQCALGISQLKKMERFIQMRMDVVSQYNRAFQNISWIKIPYESDSCHSNFHLYVLRFNFKKIGITRTEFMKNLRNKGIQTQVHYIPVYTQPFYRKQFGTNWGLCTEMEKYYQECLSIPLYPGIEDRNIKKVISAIKGLAPCLN